MKLGYWGVAAVLAWLCLVLVCETKPLNHLNWLKISSHRKKRQVSYPTPATTSATITPYPPTESAQQASTTYNPWLNGTTGASTVTPWYNRTTSPYTSYPTTTTGAAFLNSSSSPNADCSQNLTGTYGSFSSPGAGSSYSPNLDCLYTIPSPPAGSQIDITFQLFHLEEHSSCGYDFVSFSYNSQKICGQKSTPVSYSFVSQERDFKIHFHTDGSAEYRGFVATFLIQERLAWTTSVSTATPWYYRTTSPYTSYPPTGSAQQPSTTYNPWLNWTTGASTVTPWYNRTTSPYTSYATTTTGNAFLNSSSSPNPDCSQNLTGTYGSFSSPGAGSSYSPNLDCLYTIPSPPAGSQIDITFQLFHLEEHSSCGYDFVSFSYNSQKICGQKSTPVSYSYNTFGGDFAIHFVTDRSIVRRGFVLEYSFEENSCYHVLTDTEGQIQVPGNGIANYSPNLDCMFTIRPPAGGPWVVNITLDEFDIQRYYSYSSNYFSTSCSNDYMQILYDGYSSSRMCGTRTSPISYKYNIFESDLNITFHSDSSTERSGFNITYTYSNNPCVTDLDQNSGTIRTPVVEGGLTYPADTLCIYYLDLGDSLKTVTFSVRLFDVSCGDYFSINGQRFCGSRLTQTSFPLIGRINITFVSNSIGAGRGVDVDYHVTNYTCDQVYRTTSGSIDSYSVSRLALTHDVDCDYVVRPPYYPFVITMFFSPFYMPHNYMNSSVTCSGSYVEINDTQYCGTVYGQYNITSVGPELSVRYHHSATAVAGTREVYHIYYSTRPVSCNVTLTDTVGYINSYTGYGSAPVYSRSYNDSAHCIFTIKGDNAEGQTIVFRLNQFQLEDRDNSTSLCKDYVDMNGEERLCGYQYGNRSFSFDGTFVVTFTSDNSQTNMGFNIHYNIVPDGCLVSIFSTEGTLRSPVTSNGLYHNNLDCRYTLSSPYSMAKITVTVNRFDLEPPSYSSTNCYNDYVYYTDGSYSSGRYCGFVAAGTTFIWYTSARQFDLVFHSNNEVSRPGFDVSYTIEEDRCDQVLSATSGTIRSPVNSTGLYRSNLNCTYIIRPPTQGPYRFNLTFSQFDVQRTYYNSSSYSLSTSCYYDYVETRFSGLNSTSRLCGRMSSARTYFYNTFGGDFAIHFVTDRSIVRRGFVLEYSFEENSCYHVATDTEGQIQVPGNGIANYSPNLDCLFTIRPPAGPMGC
ncbi:cubilin-like isoform X1 [Haliotis rubra]|uniref:cubilin-like isoform X1 n=1 Tax=Haliotis rubra TaxID=36100 RepID=UPI001EE57F15|nr:cubilin-like isoform X1 [Haliotis rubra]XP_046549623.1 cubilin-like isoform X1 [Haliotis rubra]XP_046549632.1 cubilin-like isoform X1 [Haliotis rubra]XP_046549640.1 cubilin-like isoform X1 [Haliotis rubra]XP_046549648.1 cubilin-like isoform X1 [Haliotis rubra]